MAVIKCDKCGQHYDNEKFRSCPNCGKADIIMDETVSLPKYEKNATSGCDDETVSLEVNMGKAIADDITVGEHSIFTGTKPVTGWLVCVEGHSKGRDYRLHHGWNRIGRSHDMQVCITDDMSISRKHGAIVYDDRSNKYFAVNETGALMYLNGKNVTDAQPLENGDEIQLGDSSFVFIAFCTEGRKW